MDDNDEKGHDQRDARAHEEEHARHEAVTSAAHLEPPEFGLDGARQERERAVVHGPLLVARGAARAASRRGRPAARHHRHDEGDGGVRLVERVLGGRVVVVVGVVLHRRARPPHVLRTAAGRYNPRARYPEAAAALSSSIL